MKNYATYLLVAVLLGFTAYNCTWTKTKAKDVYVSAVENYVKTVERDGASFSAEQWDKANEKMTSFFEGDYKQYSKILTAEDEEKLAQLQGKYIALQAKHRVKGSLNKAKGLLEGIVEELEK